MKTILMKKVIASNQMKKRQHKVDFEETSSKIFLTSDILGKENGKDKKLKKKKKKTDPTPM